MNAETTITIEFPLVITSEISSKKTGHEGVIEYDLTGCTKEEVVERLVQSFKAEYNTKCGIQWKHNSDGKELFNRIFKQEGITRLKINEQFPMRGRARKPVVPSEFKPVYDLASELGLTAEEAKRILEESVKKG